MLCIFACCSASGFSAFPSCRSPATKIIERPVCEGVGVGSKAFEASAPLKTLEQLVRKSRNRTQAAFIQYIEERECSKRLRILVHPSSVSDFDENMLLVEHPCSLDGTGE